MKKYLFYLFPLIGITVMCLFVYSEAQFLLRSGANDPQIQIAQDMADRVSAAGQPQWPTDTVDIANSLNTFYTLADKDGNSTASNAVLDGKVPEIPKGVFENSKKSGENRVTWQPKKGVRVALVVRHYSGSNGEGYVAIGRSLKEVENRESQAKHLALITEVILLAVAFTGITFVLKK